MLKVVEINNLTVQYPDVKALDDVSFVINSGDFLGIIGPNGAGKSTLFDSMLGLNTKYKGTIKFFGEDIKKSKNLDSTWTSNRNSSKKHWIVLQYTSWNKY